MIKILFFALMVSLMTWFILEENYYSPKSQIKRLWKRIHRITASLPKSYFDTDSSIPSCVYSPWLEKRNQIGKVINSLLDYYFDKEKEEDINYIKENKYTDDYIKNEEFIIKKVQKLWIQEDDWVKIEKFLNKK